MGELSPLSPIPVSYTASIPGDTTLYYVKAVLRDTQSSAVLQSINLAQYSSTPNRYTGNFNAVQDSSGLGRPVDITVTVYTDSGYSDPSPNYQIYQTSYVIRQPWLPTLGSGGGLNIDYDKLQKMFDGARVSNEELINEKIRAVPTVDYDRVDSSARRFHDENKRETLAQVASMLQPLLSAVELHRQATESNHSELATSLSSLMPLFSQLERVINRKSALSSAERKTLHREVVSLMNGTHDTVKKLGKSSSKEYADRLREASDAITAQLKDGLSAKDMHFVYSPPEPKKAEKKSGFTADDIKKMNLFAP